MTLKSSFRFLKGLSISLVLVVILIACLYTPTIPDTPVRVPANQNVYGRDKPIPEHQFMYGNRISAIDCSKCHKAQKQFLYGQVNISGTMASPHTYANKVTCIRCHQDVIYDFRLPAVTKNCNTSECHKKNGILDPQKFVVSLQLMVKTRINYIQEALKKEHTLSPLKERLVRQELGSLIEDGSLGMHNQALAIQILERAEKKLGLIYDKGTGKTKSDKKSGANKLF